MSPPTPAPREARRRARLLHPPRAVSAALLLIDVISPPDLDGAEALVPPAARPDGLPGARMNDAGTCGERAETRQWRCPEHNSKQNLSRMNA